jgi:hypothetical protein
MASRPPFAGSSRPMGTLHTVASIFFSGFSACPLGAWPAAAVVPGAAFPE